ncbi:uncharacterized protein N7496_000824 [Penicillium cataractarum]|uniref:Uncharacterized protein n=1 Tax=Penicillium cataractarum TaxID=2100454 RepID=A0A9W9VUS9_9EURO|nr:uncharacterized protein N7496_000824 [Penicillium cataractarum]KAJ5389756.1 hypothetical protein N7496_000824 [Penicillium cataractarum]
MAPQKPFLYPLKTPKSHTFPSELYDDLPSSRSDSIKREDGSATPMTPLSYTQFLEKHASAAYSPSSAGAEFPKFNFEKRRPSPISVPSSASTNAPLSAYEGPKTTSATMPSPSPIAASPRSARLPNTLRRLRIPTTCVYSPITDSPRSARTIHSPFSPSDWKIRCIETPRSAGGKSVSVRQVVTRTVTYKRTHLEPPPKGKRRKSNDSQEASDGPKPSKSPRH